MIFWPVIWYGGGGGGGWGCMGSSFCGTPAKKLQNLRPAASKIIILRLWHGIYIDPKFWISKVFNQKMLITRISLFSRIKEKSLRPLFYNLKQVNNLSLFHFHFFWCTSSSNYWSSLPAGISCKSTLNRYHGFLKIIIRKAQKTHDIVLS